MTVEPSSGSCKSVGRGCEAPPSGPCYTRAKCFACGEHVCTNSDCSRRVRYYNYGIRRLCNSCLYDYRHKPGGKR